MVVGWILGFCQCCPLMRDLCPVTLLVSTSPSVETRVRDCTRHWSRDAEEGASDRGVDTLPNLLRKEYLNETSKILFDMSRVKSQTE